jgi:hypothetical protein
LGEGNQTLKGKYGNYDERKITFDVTLFDVVVDCPLGRFYL